MSVSSPWPAFHRAGIVARADVTRRGTFRARETKSERFVPGRPLQIVDLSDRLATCPTARPPADPERSLNDAGLKFPACPGVRNQVRIMAIRASSRRRWFLRDVPRTYVLFVWLGFALAAFLYAYDWHPSGWSALRQQEAAVKPQRRDTEYYTGSIVIVPAGGDLCWQRIIDNRTGQNVGQGLCQLLRGRRPAGKGSARRYEFSPDKCHRQGIQSRGR